MPVRRVSHSCVPHLRLISPARYNELRNLSRVAWLDSRAGLAPGPPGSNPYMAPLRLSTGAAAAAAPPAEPLPVLEFGGGRRLELAPDGLPRQITVRGAPLLAAPMAVVLKGGTLPSQQLRRAPRAALHDAGHAAWRADALAADGALQFVQPSGGEERKTARRASPATAPHQCA